mgnify:CR=1 FL=1
MYEVKPHPTSVDHIIVVFNTRVKHTISLPKGVGEEEVLKAIAEYLQQYEETYPETRDSSFWDELNRRLGVSVA